jgi:putative ABC transport system permease protein
MSHLIADIRFAARSLLRRPGFALISVLVLAIGIGAVTVMFSTLNAVLLRPLPFRDPGELVWCWSTIESRMNSSAAMDYFDYRERNDVFSSFAAHLIFSPGRIVTGHGDPERLPSTIVSANFFDTLGTPPLHGRVFAAEEEVEGGPNVVILSYGYWQRKLGGDPGAVGRILTIDGYSFEIVGVMPQDFAFPEDVELWFPMRRGGSWETPRGNNNFYMTGRLKKGVTLQEAQAQMAGIAKQIEDENPDVRRDWSVLLQPLHERLVGYLRVAMWILMGAVTLLLLTACANLSSLFLAKVTARSNELALRFSLGASRWAVVRQLLTESLLITMIGAAAGILLAVLGIHLVKTLGPAEIDRLDSVGIDTAVLWFAAGISVATGLLFGIMPALKSTRVDLVQSLKEGAQSTETGKSMRARSVLVVAQVALSLVLLIGSGLLIKSLYRLQNVNPGFNPDGVLTLELQLPTTRYAEPFQQEQFFSTALERIRALPGVVDASAVSGLPLRGGPWNYVYPADRPPLDPSEQIPATRRRAMDGYFRALQVPLVAGRTFEPTDRLDSRLVVVVSKKLAELAFPGENPIGKILVLTWGDGVYMEVIGVVDDLKDNGLASESRPIFYLPYRQYPDPFLSLAIRVAGEPTALTPAVRDIVRDLDKDVPISNISTLTTRVSESTSAQKFQTLLLGTFAAIALLLTAIGLYGVLAYFVSQRRRELGIRIALGASGAAVMSEVVRKGLSMASAGIALGLLGGFAAARLLQSLLFETTATDPFTYVLVSLFLVLVALTACAIPAMKAVRIDPVKALKME